MVVTRNAYALMLYVQHVLADGLQPDEDGYYRIRRKDFIAELPMKPSTFDNNIDKLVSYYLPQWDISIWFGLQGLAGETLYNDISYSRGVLQFRRNPITKHPQLQYLWARKPPLWETRDFRYEHVLVPEYFTLPLNKADFTDYEENEEA